MPKPSNWKSRRKWAAARAAWRITSSRLARVLRLPPNALVVPVEPAHLQITLISPQHVVDELIPVALLNRPELASQRALVRLTVDRIRQEQLRPWIPNVLVQGRGPDNVIQGGAFGGGPNDRLDTWGGRFDGEVALIWSLNKPGAWQQGFGSRTECRASAGSPGIHQPPGSDRPGGRASPSRARGCRGYV